MVYLMSKIAPIVLFTYNRLWHTQQTVEALQKNELANESALFIYSDGGKDEKSCEQVSELRAFLKTIVGFKSIHIVAREKNYGLADNIIDGVTEIVNKFGRIIVLEDDMVTSPYFLRYMNSNLELYKDDDRVASIHGYLYPINQELLNPFFIKGSDCWGWATWKEKWALFEKDGFQLLKELESKNITYEFDFNGSYPYTKMLKDQIAGKNNSWAIRWYASTFLSNMLTLYPPCSYLENIGFDNSGTHCGNTTKLNVQVCSKKIQYKKSDINESKEMKNLFSKFLKGL
jgi:hypothetical protein